MWQISPRAPGVPYIENRIKNLAFVHRALSTTGSSGWDKMFDLTPFLIGQITRIASALHTAPPMEL